MSLASQAAALAAFKSSKSQPDKGNQSNPSKRLSSNTNGAVNTASNKTGSISNYNQDKLPYIPKPSGSRTNSNRSLPQINTNTRSPPKKKNSTNAGANIGGDSGAAGTNVGPTGSNINSIASPTPERTSRIASAVAMTPKQSSLKGLNGPDYFTLPKTSLYEEELADTKHPDTGSRSDSIRLPRSSSAQSNLTLDHNRTQETINTLKQSLNAKKTGKDASFKRLSQHTAPQEMLQKIRHSFVDSTKSASSSDIHKNKERINEIRESIDLKRIHTPVSANLAVSMEQLSLSEEYLSDSAPSIVSSVQSQTNPIIITTAHEENPQDNDSNGRETRTTKSQDTTDQPESDKSPTNNSSASINGSEDNFQKPLTPMLSYGSAASPVSPIIVPPSLSANAREAALGSNESLPNINRYKQSFDSRASFDSTKASDESFKKPKRKPPPHSAKDATESTLDFTDKEYSTDSTRARDSNYLGPYDRSAYPYNRASDLYDRASRSLFDLESAYSEGSYQDPYSELESVANESASKLPQFPNIGAKKSHQHHHPNFHHQEQSSSSDKEHKRSLFKRKSKLKGINKIDLPGVDIDTSESTASSRPSTPVMTRPQVQFKTTMRKDPKRKNAFNEDKPWKNHTDLSYVSEIERKRYEGVWVSNKGLYINKVLTKLQGVNYDNMNEDEVLKVESNVNPSMQAAKLSSKNINHEISSLDDFNQFHSLDLVEPDQLILGSVVKRIWLRSRLPHETLEQIWNLVDYRKDGTLNKPEFIVGMWLVDQCLYGRKLPKVVSNQVWSSLENIGLSVVIKKRGRR